MSCAAAAALALALVGAPSARPVLAGTGSTFFCPIEGEIPAKVYLDITVRHATLEAQGTSYEVNATGGRFELRTEDRSYYFAPKWNGGQSTLTIATSNETRVVKCSGG